MTQSASLDLVAAMPREAAERLDPALGLTCVAQGGLALVLAPPPPPAGLRARLMGQAPRAAVEQLVQRQRLLEALHASGTVLPARPGQRLAVSHGAAVLAAHAEALEAAMAAMAGQAQYQILIRWLPGEAFLRFGTEPELAGLRDPVAMAAGAEALRQRLGAEFAARLGRQATDAAALPLEAGPQMLVNLAVLVAREGIGPLEAELEAIDAVWPEGLSIRLIGPGPGVSFAAFELAAPGSAAVEARSALGLGPAPTETGIRAALRRAAMADPAGGARLTEAADLLRRLARGEACIAAAGLAPVAEGVPLIRFLREGDVPSAGLAPVAAPVGAVA